MAVLLDPGIQKILHQARIPDGPGLPVFPSAKSSRPLGAQTPSNLQKVFSPGRATQLIENMIRPNIAEVDVILQHEYGALLKQVRGMVLRSYAKAGKDRKKFEKAKNLLDKMNDDYQAFCAGRDTLVRS